MKLTLRKALERARARQTFSLKLTVKKAFSKLFARQTFSLVFLWVLTWFSYEIFMKSQVNFLNIVGAAVSAGLIVLPYILPSQSAVFRAKKVGMPQISRVIKVPHLHEQLDSQGNSKISPSTLTRQIPATTIQMEKSPEQITSLERQEQNAQILSAGKSQEPFKSNDCPKNLDYFTKKPRPKLPPEECMSCKNLVNCVCLTSD